MSLKERIADSIERKLGLKDKGLISPFSLYNTIRRMQIIKNLFTVKKTTGVMCKKRTDFTHIYNLDN